MSWWDTGKDDDVIGDQPADLARQALQQIAVARAERSQERPALVDVLRAIGKVAIGDAGRWLADTPADLRQIVAELKLGPPVSSGPLRDDAASSDLVGPLTESLRAIEGAYQERWERKPRFSEWLEAFAFVLRYRPEDFLRDSADHPPVRIKAE
jgi:hypothetical protein